MLRFAGIYLSMQVFSLLPTPLLRLLANLIFSSVPPRATIANYLSSPQEGWTWKTLCHIFPKYSYRWWNSFDGSNGIMFFFLFQFGIVAMVG